jgi:hypothetical protein
MTLLTQKPRFYYRCILDPAHTFETVTHRPYLICPDCGGRMNLYGLKDSTRYADDSPVEPMEPRS